MRAVTLAQAALFAAVAMVLLTVFYLADNVGLIQNAPALVLLGSAVPSLVWAGFFFRVHWSPDSARTAAWITLVFAVLLEAMVVYIRFQHSVNYWTPFGNAFRLSGWMLRLGWAVFLISFALDNSHTRRVSLVLAIISAPFALNVAYGAFNNWIGVLFDDIPRQAVWRVLLTPAIHTIYWLSQILFLWTTWGNPASRDPVGTTSRRLAP